MKFYIFIILTFIISSSISRTDEVKGREFIATFLPNYHNNWYEPDDRYRLGDSVYLFIYAEKATKVIIEYGSVSIPDYIDTISIAENSIYIFKKPAYSFALIGFNLSGYIDNRIHSERVTDVSFRITSEQPIIVYGHSQATLTSESFNVLPLESLGNEYIVAAYNNSKYMESNGGINGTTPSQFAIVAAEDDTEVFIDPSVATRFNGTNNQNIKLNKNEVYLVQANISSQAAYQDLTGTYIKSNKPIAVFGGQQRAAVPYDISGSSPSRDYLVEQIPTLEAWSLECLVVPFPQPSNIGTKNINDVFRIIAGFDNTEIYIEDRMFDKDTYYGTLNRGKYFELPLDKAYKIKGSAPILVVAFKRSSQVLQGDNRLGDPLMQIIPSADQYGNSYKFINIQAYQYNNFEDYERVYDEHYITLIIHKNSLNKVVLDGVNLNTNSFAQIVSTDYYYGYKEVSEGVHTISAPDNFGLFVAGYGFANSYGYFSGVITKRDDFEPPTFQSSIDCFEIIGKIEDKRIASATSDESRLNNINLNIETFNPYVQELGFSASLVNTKQDGNARIIAKDSIGQQNYLDINIPGFTIGLTSFSNIEQIEPQVIYDTLPIFENKCYNFTLRNYGKFTQEISKSFLKISKNFTTNLPESFYLEPNQTFDFNVCLLSDSNSIFIDTLFLENSCYSQNLVVLDLRSKKDDNNPVLTSKKDPCNEKISIVITDSTQTDRGIKELNIDEAINLDIIETTRSKSLINIEAAVIDFYQDSYISLSVTDSAGLTTIYRDTIPGFTIELASANNSKNIDFGNKKIGIDHCESISLTNYGNFDLTLKDVNLAHNIYFSIPLNQLPFIIKSGESKDLEICFKGYIASTLSIYDTLKLNYNCLDKIISLESVPDSLIIDNKSRCDVNLIFSAGVIPNQNTVSKIYPNPANSKIKFILNNAHKSLIQGKVFDLSGNLMLEYLNNYYNNGIYEINVSIEELPSGVYLNLISIDNEKFTEIFIIDK